jgi:hypothetical protein
MQRWLLSSVRASVLAVSSLIDEDAASAAIVNVGVPLSQYA